MAGHTDAYTKGVAEDIVAGIARPDITEVWVSRQYIGAKGIKDVAAAVAASSTLHTLDLDRWLLHPSHHSAVVFFVKELPFLPSDVKLSASMSVLFDAVAQNKSLKKLIIYGLLSLSHKKQLSPLNGLCLDPR